MTGNNNDFRIAKEKTLKLISYHSFLFPFRWDYCNRNRLKDIHGISYKKRLDVKRFAEALKSGWEYVPFKITNAEDYNEYVYFYEYVREAVYNTEGKKGRLKNNRTTYLFRYNLPKDRKLFYNVYIKRGGSELNSPDTYRLVVDEISMKTFNTGVAILQFNLKNLKYNSPEQILEINDFGRRIYPQFLGDFDEQDEEKRGVMATKSAYFADRIEIEEAPFENGYNESDDYYSSVENLIVEKNQNPTRIPYFIANLMGERFKNKYDEKGSRLKKGDVLINPIVDDRMFVICSYANKNCFPTEATYNEHDFWYKYLFVDGGSKGCDCVSMEKQLLEDHSYIRWIGSGGIHGVSRYSFMYLTNCDDFSQNIAFRHNKTMYSQIILIALAQRASILRFSDEVTYISSLKRKVADRISELYKNYIKFINKMYFREVTAQEQGIEIYDKVLTHMRIKADIKDLDDEIAELHDYANLLADKKTNNILTTLGVIGFLFLTPTFITGFLGMSMFTENFFKGYTGGALGFLQNPNFENWIYISLITFPLAGILFLFIVYIVKRFKS